MLLRKVHGSSFAITLQCAFASRTFALHKSPLTLRQCGLGSRNYDDKILLTIGNVVGKALTVDRNTHFAISGKFARVYVQLDFTKPLVPQIEIDGHLNNVEYEGLSLICFH